MTHHLESLSYSDRLIASAIIFGGLGLSVFIVLGVCGLFALCRRTNEYRSGRRRSNNSIVREQSMSVVRGEHPIAFMLPTVSLSEAGSETDPTPSDLDSLGYQSSQPSSPALSFTSLSGGSHYSGSFLSPASGSYARGTLSPPTSFQQQQYLLAQQPRSLQYMPVRSPGGHHASYSYSGCGSTSTRGSSSGWSSPRGPRPPFRQFSRQGTEEEDEEGEDGEDKDGREERSGRPAASGALGKVGLRLTYKSTKELQVKVLRCEKLPVNFKTGTANTSVRLSLLPNKIPKFTTSTVEDSLNPDFNEEFVFPIGKEGLAGKVLRITVFDHDRSVKKSIGGSLVALSDVGFSPDRDFQVKEVWSPLKERVEPDLTELLADRLQLALRYEPDPGRLTLGVQTAKILSIPTTDKDTDIYVKVALLHGRRVIKAKKTRALTASDELSYQENFSILLPSNFIDEVSCIISLCSRSRFGTKQVLGRTSVGPFAYCSGPGLQQWQEMIKNPAEDITTIHPML